MYEHNNGMHTQRNLWTSDVSAPFHIIIVRNNAIDDAASCYSVAECPSSVSKCNNLATYTKPASSYTSASARPLYKGVALSQNEYALLKRLKCSVYDRLDISGNVISCKPFAGST
jgi:hypothetical protein